MSEIRAKRISLDRLLPFSVKITLLLTIFIDFDFYLLTSPGCELHPELHPRYFERVVADINRGKLGAYKPAGPGCRKPS